MLSEFRCFRFSDARGPIREERAAALGEVRERRVRGWGRCNIPRVLLRCYTVLHECYTVLHECYTVEVLHGVTRVLHSWDVTHRPALEGHGGAGGGAGGGEGAGKGGGCGERHHLLRGRAAAASRRRRQGAIKSGVDTIRG
eukprot:1175455-Prorocentrum_minimum.AAC.2